MGLRRKLESQGKLKVIIDLAKEIEANSGRCFFLHGPRGTHVVKYNHKSTIKDVMRSFNIDVGRHWLLNGRDIVINEKASLKDAKIQPGSCVEVH